MKVKELFQLIKPLRTPEIIVYDTKANDGFVYESSTGSSIQDFLKNYALGPAIERALIGGSLYTSRDVWGKEVRYNKHIEGDKWEVVSHKLRNYYAPVEFTENEVRFLTDYYDKDRLINMVAREIRKQNIKMFGGKRFLDLPLAEKNDYICHQLCDWYWVENDAGTILNETKDQYGFTYTATLAKYAIVLDENGEPLDV